MDRRSFVKQSAIASGTTLVGGLLSTDIANAKAKSFTVLADNSTALTTSIVVQGLTKPVKILQISDAHISCDNESDEAYKPYSARMGKAYVVTQHALTKKQTNPMECFSGLMEMAKKEKPDLIVLSGDLINYPSATAVNFVLDQVKSSGLPWVYTAGNHDWHYEGMEGSSDFLRKIWINNRLTPLYNGKNPLYFNEIVNGLNVVVLDNSTYQINQEQLNFYLDQKKQKTPIALFVHIPIYMPTMHVGSCGHPKWGKDTDRGYETERREPWPAEGNSASTKQFISSVFDTPQLIGIFAGHWHNYHTISYKGVNQHLAFPAFSGNYRMIDISGEA